MAILLTQVTINKLAGTSLIPGVNSLVLQDDAADYDTHKLVYAGFDINQSFNTISIWCETKDVHISVETDPDDLFDVTAGVPGDGVIVLEKLQRHTFPALLIKRVRFAVATSTAVVNITLGRRLPMATQYDMIAFTKNAERNVSDGVSELALVAGMPNYATRKMTYLGSDIDQVFDGVVISVEGLDCYVSVETDPDNDIVINDPLNYIVPYEGIVFVPAGTQVVIYKPGLKRMRYTAAETTAVNFMLFTNAARP